MFIFAPQTSTGSLLFAVSSDELWVHCAGQSKQRGALMDAEREDGHLHWVGRLRKVCLGQWHLSCHWEKLLKLTGQGMGVVGY